MILGPGEYTRWSLFANYQCQIFDMEKVQLDSPFAEYLRRHEAEVVNENFYIADVADEEVVLRYEMRAWSKFYRQAHANCSGNGVRRRALR
jgi:hypothetical protein